MSKKKTRGILLIAVGHPYYGMLAHNLAMALTVKSSLPITVAVDEAGGRHLTPQHKLLFDVVEVPHHMTHTNGLFSGVKAKLYLNELSPYDETLFLDADTMWLPKKNVEELMDSVDGDLAIQNRGYADMKNKAADLPPNHNQWVELAKVKEAYKMRSGRYYNFFSEVIYFKRAKDTEMFFKMAQKVRKEWKVPLAKSFASDVPDEACFAIASCLTKVYPHQQNWIPSYWWHFHRDNLSITDIYAQYYIYSIGGNHQPNNVVKNYDNLAQYYAQQLGWTPFKHKNKRTWAANRTDI
jgi:hypothetical protein